MADFQRCFHNHPSGVFMAHLVAGYPSMSLSGDIARTLIRNGADFLEIQIPFTDPLADGPVIMDACSVALQGGATPDSTFKLVSEITCSTDTPVIIMTYCSIPLKTGIRRFVKKLVNSGAAGLIIPDLPFDSPEGAILHELCGRNGISLIPVVSPGMEAERLKEVLLRGSGFVYATLKVGITGSLKESAAGKRFLTRLSGLTDLPVVAGFGITSTSDACDVCNFARGAVVGSHLLRLYNALGIEALGSFAGDLSSRLQEEVPDV